MYKEVQIQLNINIRKQLNTIANLRLSQSFSLGHRLVCCKVSWDWVSHLRCFSNYIKLVLLLSFILFILLLSLMIFCTLITHPIKYLLNTVVLLLQFRDRLIIEIRLFCFVESISITWEINLKSNEHDCLTVSGLIRYPETSEL